MKKTLIALMLGCIMGTAVADNINTTHVTTSGVKDVDINNLQNITIESKTPTANNEKSLTTLTFGGHTGGTYDSYTLSVGDTDTYIVKSDIVNDKYIITDNMGNQFTTGEVSKAGINTITEVEGSDAVKVTDSGTDGNHNYKIDLSDNTKKTLGQVETNKNDIADLSGRVSTNEGNITNLDNRVTTNETNISNNTKNISNINTLVKTHDESINNLNNLYAENSSKIAQNRADIDKLGKKVDWMNRKIDDLRDDMYDMGASMAALAGIHYQSMNEHESQLAMAIGQYKGRQAVALGLSHQVTDRIQIHASGTAGRESMFNIGGSIKF